jgi:Tfp pilus assembly PilM family ATPase
VSRLLSNLKTKLWPLPPGAIGLGFSKNSVMAVRALREEGGYCLTHIAEEVLPFSLFTNAAPREEDCACLAQAMQRIAASIPQTYWPLQIALPDPAAIIQVMEFDSLPPKPHERAAIAQFRLDKEFPALPQMQCSTQVISNEGEKGLLLALFIQRAWLDCLNDACRVAGIVPGVIDISINHLFNRFYDVVQATSNDGVLISMEPDTWSILFWDAAHRPRFVKSRWRDSNAGTDGEYEDIAQEVERLIMSYVLRVPGRKIDGIYLCAGEDDRTSLAARLDERMQMPCVQLEVSGKFSMAPGVSGQDIPPGLLAVAVPRI